MINLLNYINKYCKLTYTTLITCVNNVLNNTNFIVNTVIVNNIKNNVHKFVSSIITDDYEIPHVNTYKYIFLQLLLFYMIIDTQIDLIKNTLFNLFASIAYDHTINILYFDIEKNHSITYLPSLYFLKYFSIPQKPNEIYFNITMWSSKKRAYVTIFIDGILLHELRNIYPDNPYTVPHIVDLLKYSNTIDYIDIVHTKKKYKTYDKINKKQIEPYLRSFAIPNNITVRAFEFLYAYLQKDYINFNELKFLVPYNYVVKNYNMEVVLVHTNMYKTRFTESNDIIYSSLDVNVCD